MHVDTLRGNRDVSQMPYNSAHSPMLTRTDHISSLDHRTRLFIRRCATICFFLFGMIILEGAEVVTPQKSEGGNASNATTKLVAQARLLAMLSQVVIQLEHYVQSKDLSAIHNEDVILTAAASELLTQADRKSVV